jgi:hypothetical protein
MVVYYNRARYLNTSAGRFCTMDSPEGHDEIQVIPVVGANKLSDSHFPIYVLRKTASVSARPESAATYLLAPGPSLALFCFESQPVINL